MDIRSLTYTREDADAMLGTLPATSAGPLTACPQGFAPHTLQPGESLRSLAEAHGLTVNELLLYNPELNPYHYKCGDTVCLPAMQEAAEESAPTATEETQTAAAQTGEAPASDVPAAETTAAEMPAAEETAAPDCARFYRVKSGDTLHSIADRYQIPLDRLTAANPGAVSTQLMVGQLLCLPKDAACDGGKRVRVPAGALFEDFLLRYDLPFAALRDQNPDVDLLALREGQVLRVPNTGAECKYTLGEGETLATLTEKSGLSAGQLLAANPYLAPSDFAAGRSVCLPIK